MLKTKKPDIVSNEFPWEIILVEVEGGRWKLHAYRQLTPNAPVFIAGALAPYEVRQYLGLQSDSPDLLVFDDITAEFLLKGADDFTAKDITGTIPELGEARTFSAQCMIDFKFHNDDEMRRYKARLKRAANAKLESIRNGPTYPQGRPTNPRKVRADPLLVERRKRDTT